MLSRLTQALSSLRSGSRKRVGALPVVGAVYAIGDHVYFEIRRRDEEGNDFSYDARGPFCLSSSDQELGQHLLDSLIGSDECGAPLEVSARSKGWKNVLRKLGFKSERALVSSAENIMVTGIRNQELLQQPCVREEDMFVGANEAYSRRTPWDPVVAGNALKELVETIRSNNVSIDPPPTNAPVRSKDRAALLTFHVGDLVWHSVRQQACRVIEVDPEDQHGLGRITVIFEDGSKLSSPLLAPGLEAMPVSSS